jgi:hypothetical protein
MDTIEKLYIMGLIKLTFVQYFIVHNYKNIIQKYLFINIYT